MDLDMSKVRDELQALNTRLGHHILHTTIVMYQQHALLARENTVQFIENTYRYTNH